MLFPNHTYSDITRIPLSKKPIEATKIPKILETFEEWHELRQLIESLRQCIEASKTAWNAYQQAAEKLKDLQTNEELAKGAVRQQYFERPRRKIKANTGRTAKLLQHSPYFPA